MANWGTITRECSLEIGQSTSSTASLDNIKQAICEAIRFNQSFGPFKFQEKEVSLPVTVNSEDVSLPSDYASVVGDIYYVIGDSPTVRRRLDLKGLDEVLQSLTRLSDEYSNTFSSLPRVVAIDALRNVIKMSPRPGDGTDTIELRYLKNGQAPIAKYVSSAWEFHDPSSGVVIDDNYTNEWFTDGRYLTKTRALYILWQRWYGGTDAASAKAQGYLMQWTEELNKLNRETAKAKSVHLVRRYI